MKIVGLIFLSLLLTGCGQSDTGEDEYVLDMEHPLYSYFLKAYPDKKALLSLAGDCNDDGIEDLIIVYRESASENKLVAIYSQGDGYLLTEPIPAPLEHCRLEWKDIDERPPLELLVSGQKGIYIGYAVFRLVDGRWVSLFGDGMEKCC